MNQTKTNTDDLNINGNWHEKRDRLKQKFSALTDNDLNYSEGDEDILVGRIQQRLGVPKDIAQKIIRYA